MKEKGILVERPTYEEEILRWRQKMEDDLRAEDGWLTLIGLFWLAEGENRFGAAEDNQIVLPADKAPPHAGSFVLRGGAVTLEAAPEAPVLLDGRPVSSRALQAGADPELISLGDLDMFVIRRGDRYAIRARDRRHPARETFAGRHWMPVDEEYRVVARFSAYDPPRTVSIATVLGTIEERVNPGFLTFTLKGQECRLEALVEDDKLFILFRDQTSGDTTYPAARYLKAAMPEHGLTTLDFNRAYSPPCAFTAFATCPLPPPQNRLPLRVEAGELYH